MGKAATGQGASAVLALMRSGRLDEAKVLAQRLVRAEPRRAELNQVMAKLCLMLGELQQACRHAQVLLEVSPYQQAHREAYHEVLNHLHQLRQFPMMEEAGLWLTRQNPKDGHGWNLLGISYIEQGKFGPAALALHQALTLLPKNVHVLSNMGNVLIGTERAGEAIPYLELALQIEPKLVAAYNNLGNAYRYAGRVNEAISIYLQGIALAPQYAELRSNLGVAYSELQRYADAIACFEQALALNPKLFPVYANLADALRQMGRLQEAIECCHRAFELEPDIQEVWVIYGNVLRDANHLDAAIKAYVRALSYQNIRQEAFNLRVYTSLLFCLNYHPDLSPETIYSAYRDYNTRYGLPHQAEWREFANAPNPKKKLRVGYLNHSYYNHVCKLFLLPLLEQHDKNEVEVFAYANPSREDEFTLLYKKAVDHWIPTRDMSDADLAQRIRDDGIDILVDIAGHTNDNRLPVMARKPAPVSLHWLDFGYTTGLTAIDYYLTDHATVTDDCAHLFSEKVWCLDGPAYAYRPGPGMGEVGDLPAAQTGIVTFGSLSRAARINHRVVHVWAAILDAMPNSRLIIDSGDYKDPAVQEEMAARFTQFGIDRSRLEIGCHSPPWDVMRRIDIGLDCFPHNSGTTLFEMLYMGIPYVTLAGRPSVGRIGASILTGLGRTEWIACSEEEYAQKAIMLAHDIPGLRVMRANLRQQIQASPLMDEGGFARSVEKAYRQMWQIYCDEASRKA